MADPTSRDGAFYADADVLHWLAELHAPHDDALEAAFDAHTRDGLPPIQVGPSEGKTLQLLLRLAGARVVVEVGTLAGYSAIWMARALPETGHLYTVEHDEKHAAVARRNVKTAGLADRVTVVVGDGPDALAEIEGMIDGPVCAVFVDADKGRYDIYGRWATDHLRSGGLLIGDNAFFFGKLLEPDNAAAAAMRRFHEHMRAHYDSVNIPTPDGLAVGIKR